MCEQYINIEEIHKGIEKSKDNKAAGNYGLTCEFYKEIKDISDFFFLMLSRKY